MNGQQNLPGMVVQKLDGFVKYIQRQYVVDKDLSTPEKKRYKMEEVEKRRDAGYLITFPIKGHSIRVDADELERLKSRLNDPNGYVEAEASTSGEQVMRASGGGALVHIYQEGAK